MSGGHTRTERCPICGTTIIRIPEYETTYTCSGFMADQEHDPTEMKEIEDEGL